MYFYDVQPVLSLCAKRLIVSLHGSFLGRLHCYSLPPGSISHLPPHTQLLGFCHMLPLNPPRAAQLPWFKLAVLGAWWGTQPLAAPWPCLAAGHQRVGPWPLEPGRHTKALLLQLAAHFATGLAGWPGCCRSGAPAWLQALRCSLGAPTGSRQLQPCKEFCPLAAWRRGSP